jgi:hypothetical protein
MPQSVMARTTGNAGNKAQKGVKFGDGHLSLEDTNFMKAKSSDRQVF